MKKCTNPNCLTVAPSDDDAFCGVCGAPLAAYPQMPQEPQPVYQEQQPVYQEQQPQPVYQQQPVYREQQPVYQQPQPQQYYGEQQPQPVYQEQQPVYQQQQPQPQYYEQQPVYQQPQYQEQPAYQQYEYRPAGTPEKPEKKKKWFKPLFIVMLSVILVLAAAIAFVVLDPFGLKDTALTADEMIQLGDKYLLELDYEPALVEFIKVIEVEPMNPRGYTGAAEAYVGLNKPEDAKVILEQGLEVLPGNREIADMLDYIERLLNELLHRDDILIDITQIDSSSFPIVRFYVNITDTEGEVIEGLNLDIFDVLELDAAGNWTQAEIEELRQLLVSDSMNIGLVIDKSGSMSDYNRMEQARNAASYFLTYLEGESNNLVEVTYFDSSVIVPHTFTEDYETLRDYLYYFPADGGTALYDALYSALLRTDAQNGAKCIIAFTDGEENASRATLEDVTLLAQATGIPIYMIGVGLDINEYVLKQIADITGGAYFSSENTDLEETLQSIYLNVFRTHRNQYIVEYKSIITDTLETLHQIRFRARDDSGYAGETMRDYIPVAPAPPQVFSPQPQTLLDAIFNTGYWVRLTIDRPATGRGSTIFERDLNSNIWLITSISGDFRIADPMFRQSGDAVLIEFATTTNTYILNDGAIGLSGNGIGASKDSVVWSVEIGNDYPLGSFYDENLKDNLRQSIEDYTLVAINVYFNNGDKAILYYNLDYKWNFKPRGFGFSGINPSISYDNGITVFTFTYESTEYRYELHDGGYANVNGESAIWNYAYYVR